MFTATAQRANIVLPANTSTERNNIAVRKRSDFIIAMHKALPSLGESRSDFSICNATAEKLGVGADFNEGWDKMGWLCHLYEASRADTRHRLGAEMPDFDAFWAAGYVRCPVKTSHTYLAEFRDKPEDNLLNTECGRIVLGSNELARLD